MGKTAVVALGGNALVKPGQKGTIYEQFATTRETCQSLVRMVEDGWDLVLTHGNGPQVGALLLQQEVSKDFTPAMPLGICVAQSQGQIGYMVQQCLTNALKKKGINKEVVTLITQVMVDNNDPAFQNPLKPIGPLYEEDKALERLKMGYPMIKQKNGWRMVVPSPTPISIIEDKIIKKLVDDGYIVITAGGGGMPVINDNGALEGKEAVIDKDLVSERLATALKADLLLLLTDVDYVYLEKNQLIYQATRKEMEEYLEMGFFPEGSMGPKILAGITFLKRGGRRVAITSLEKAWEAAKGEFGTQIQDS